MSDLVGRADELDSALAALPAYGDIVPLWYLGQERLNVTALMFRYADPGRALAAARKHHRLVVSGGYSDMAQVTLIRLVTLLCDQGLYAEAQLRSALDHARNGAADG